MLDIKVDYSLPEIELISFSETNQKIFLQNDIYILVLHTSFTLFKTRITGDILIALSLSSVSLLMKKIDELSEDLIGKADIAMYRRKKSGKNNFMFFDSK